MKPTEKHKRICEVIKGQVDFWANNNDIYSPTVYCDNEQNIDNLVLEGLICDEDAELLTEALNELYHQVKHIGLTK